MGYVKAAFQIVGYALSTPVVILMVSGAGWALWTAVTRVGDWAFGWNPYVPFWDISYWVVVFYLTTAALWALSKQYFGGRRKADSNEERDDRSNTPIFAGLLLTIFPTLLVVGMFDSRPDTYLSPEYMNFSDIAMIILDELAKGLFFDIFEYFKIDTIPFEYHLGYNIETVSGFIHRVVAGPFAVFAVFMMGRQ